MAGRIPVNGLIPRVPGSQFPAEEDRIYARMDVAATDGQPSRVQEGDTKFLFTTALYTCVGIAVSGTYPPPADGQAPTTTNERYDRFMIHTSELNMKNTCPVLRKEVEAAKAQGLQDLQVHFTTTDPASMVEKESQEYVVHRHTNQAKLMRFLRQLVGSSVNSDDQPRIHWYPYPHCQNLDCASMAMFSDRSVVVEHQNQVGFSDPITRWPLQEKPWVSTAPAGASGSGGSGSNSSAGSIPSGGNNNKC
ncbi:hypothetical protein PG993_005875 [Apiospora rasikravindrae]|uniref:Uncharacterized protein n=1 Tax=Apiospora rasikravindrae TaxID=990691 RepID=A0ABR1TBT5_9PEZI